MKKEPTLEELLRVTAVCVSAKKSEGFSPPEKKMVAKQKYISESESRYESRLEKARSLLYSLTIPAGVVSTAGALFDNIFGSGYYAMSGLVGLISGAGLCMLTGIKDKKSIEEKERIKHSVLTDFTVGELARTGFLGGLIGSVSWYSATVLCYSAQGSPGKIEPILSGLFGGLFGGFGALVSLFWYAGRGKDYEG